MPQKGTITLRNISFFSAADRPRRYMEPSGKAVKAPDDGGATFLYEIEKGEMPLAQIEVFVFDNSRSLIDLEDDARMQLKQILETLGEMGETMTLDTFQGSGS